MPRGLSRTIARAAAREAGVAPSVAGLSAVTTGRGGNFTTVFTFNGMQVPVTSALKYASQKIFDFAAGKVRILGGTANLRFSVTTTRASTINAAAAMTWGIGTAAASSVTLATTMQDIIAITARTLDGTDAALSTASKADVAAAATHDGTGTAKDAYLNLAFATAADVDANGTVAVYGTVTVRWENWGNNA